MPKELTDEQRAEVVREKEKTLRTYSEKLHIFLQKIRQWDDDVNAKKSPNGKRMWREGKNKMRSYEKSVEQEIRKLKKIPEEQWEQRDDHFDAVMDRFMNVYNEVVAKIRYDNPGDRLQNKVFKQN